MITAGQERKRATIDITRHVQHFDPHVFADTRVGVVGCGSVGARIAMEVGCFGISNLHLFDGQRVDKENIANQRPFTQEDLALRRFKVDALARHLVAAGAAEPVQHPEHVLKPTDLGRVVFLAVDSMTARVKIFEECLYLKPWTDYVIEVRMGIDELRCYGFNPRLRHHVEEWRASLYEDEKTQENACQVQTTIGGTAMITAGVAVTRFRHWYRKEIARDPAYAKDLPVEQVIMLRPLLAFCQ